MFIAHAEEPRTFSNAKSANRAIKRDLARQPENLYVTGTEVRPNKNGRFEVLVYVDHDEDEAREFVTDALAGFFIVPSKGVEEPTRIKGVVNVTPTAPLLPCRVGSKQQLILDMIARPEGATIEDLRKVCVRKDGRPWDDGSIRSALYYDLKNKGYGVRTEWRGEEPVYHAILPEGYDEPLPPKPKKGS